MNASPGNSKEADMAGVWIPGNDGEGDKAREEASLWKHDKTSGVFGSHGES